MNKVSTPSPPGYVMFVTTWSILGFFLLSSENSRKSSLRQAGNQKAWISIKHHKGFICVWTEEVWLYRTCMTSEELSQSFATVKVPTELRKLSLLFKWRHCVRQAGCIVDYKEIFGALLFGVHPKNRKAKKLEKKLVETIYCILSPVFLFFFSYSR